MIDTKRSVFHGRSLTVEIYGASHDAKIGGVLTGLTHSYPIDLKELKAFCDRRRPVFIGSTARKEEDIPTVFGLQNATSERIEVVFDNKDVRSSSYHFADTPRPSHADFVGYTKYENYDGRGGGKFSGRLTAPLVYLGGICKQILEQKGITVSAKVKSIGGETEEEKIKLLLEKTIQEGDSVGGRIDCVCEGLPVGVGEYMFDSLEGAISRLVFAVPGVKGIEFGAGFSFADMKGSQANDAFCFDGERVATKTNHSGGINGGISNGMPLTFTVAVRPTPSIGLEQDTVNIKTHENVKIKIQGRHDVCIVPRAAVCVEAACAIAVLDNVLGDNL